MTNPLPPLPPQVVQKLDEFHASCEQVLDGYVHGFEMDMNRHAVKHGAMDDARAVNDFTRILLKDVPHNMLGGLLAVAILRLIKRKAKGRG